MEIEEETSFSSEVNKNVKAYLHLALNNIGNSDVLYEQFAELFSCDFHIKNGLVIQIWKRILQYIWSSSSQSDKYCYFKIFEKCLVANTNVEISNGMANILLESILGNFYIIFLNYFPL